MRRTVWVRSSRKRAGRGLLTNGRVRVTTPARQVTGEARREIEARLRRDGILPRANEERS